MPDADLGRNEDITTESDCVDLCAKNPECVAVTFVKSTHERHGCYPKSGINGREKRTTEMVSFDMKCLEHSSSNCKLSRNIFFKVL